MDMKWYSNRYRRHLCDMHIDGWDERFLSEFSPEDYVTNLLAAKINAPMLYFQSHAGWCYYPTKFDCVHPAFREQPDRMRRLVDLCHEHGMAVVGYYSLNYNTWAHDQQPDWRMVDRNGLSNRERDNSRYGFCCPNNADYRKFVRDQIQEMLTYFKVEGMFYDMPFWPQTCYCEKCRARWAAEVGGEMPTNDHDPRWEKLLERKRTWMGEWAQEVTDYTKAICPEISVEHNFANAIAGGADLAISDAVNEACDYTGGDLYKGLYSQSFTCKYFHAVTKNQPFEYMTTRAPDLGKHTIIKSERELLTEVMITCAHSGASLIIDAIDPVGTLDKRVYRTVGNVFEQEEPYEKYLGGTILMDAAVIYDLPSKALRHGQHFSNHDAALQAATTLLQAHVPTGVVTYRQMNTLQQYPVLIAPLLHTLSEEAIEALMSYVWDGGRLYVSGAEDESLIARLLGAKVKGFTEHQRTYIAPIQGQEPLFDDYSSKYPLPFDMCAPMLESLSAECEVLAHVALPYTTQNNRLFASIHSDPPGESTNIPAVIRRKLGKGEVLWCAMPVELDSAAAPRRIFLNLLRLIGMRPRLETSASRIVEIVVMKDEMGLRVSAVRLSDEFDGKLPAFEVNIQSDQAPEKVMLLPDETDIPFEYADGWIRFQARALDTFDMYRLQTKRS